MVQNVIMQLKRRMVLSLMVGLLVVVPGCLASSMMPSPCEDKRLLELQHKPTLTLSDTERIEYTELVQRCLNYEKSLRESRSDVFWKGILSGVVVGALIALVLLLQMAAH